MWKLLAKYQMGDALTHQDLDDLMRLGEWWRGFHESLNNMKEANRIWVKVMRVIRNRGRKPGGEKKYVPPLEMKDLLEM